jgi:selenoprotein W-related protein
MSDLTVPLPVQKHRITIEYCVPCDYSASALGAVQELVRTYQHGIGELTLKMGSGGAFEVQVDGRTLFSKKALGRDPEPHEVLRLFKAFVGPSLRPYPRE